MQVLVKHPWKPDVWVVATCRTEAIIRAAIAWGCGFTDVAAGAKCYVRQADNPSSGAARHLPPEGKAGPSSGAARHLPPEGKAAGEEIV